MQQPLLKNNPRRAMKFTPRSRNSGFGLVEAIIVAAAVAMAVAGVYRFYSSVQARERAHTEAQHAVQISNNILRSYSSLGNFTTVSDARLVSESVLPPGIEVTGPTGSPTISSVFGGTISVSSRNLDGQDGDSLTITYSDVPKRICSQFVSNAAAGFNFRSIQVNSNDVLAANRSLDEGQAVSQCASSPTSTVAFTISRDHSSVATAPGLCSVPASSPETQTISCPAGYSGEITQTRTASCPPGASVPVWGDWSVTSNTCTMVCTPDPSSPQTRTSTPCPAGLYGTITERRVSACAPGQTSGAPSWSDWVEVSNTCSPQCVAPADEIRSPGCPPGQSGEFTERRSATCPSPTSNPVWGPWTTITNTCEQVCTLPSPNPETRWVDTSGNCDDGYSGSKYWQVEQTRTASCPQSTGQPTFTPWQNTGRTRNEDTSHCTSLCTPEPQLERWVPRSEACPAGFSGARSWEERQTRTSSCPPGASSPITSQWTFTGERRNIVDECDAQACRVNQGATFKWQQPGNSYECEGTVASDTLIPSGQMLTVEGGATVSNAIGPDNLNFRAAGQAQYVCNAGVLSQQPTAPTCAPASCNVNGNQTANWAQPGQPDIACTARYSSATSGGGNFSVPVGSDFTVRDTTGPVFGTMVVQCVQSTVPGLGSVASTMETSNRVCYGSCDTTPRPNPDTRTHAGCASGQYGTWVQTDAYESAAYPTCWTNTVNEWLPASAPAGACTNCPSPTTELQWGATSDGICPANHYGFTGREKQQRRTKSYNCPAGTASLPSPNYTSWTDTGEVRVVDNRCLTCPQPVEETRWEPASDTATCPSGQYGYIGRERQQVRTKSYNCPAGTLTLPSPSYTSWKNTSNYRPTTNSCVSCPAAETEEQTRWVDHSAAACSSGQYGAIAREKLQRRTRVKSYNCPSGTATLPSPSYTSWTAWSDTGQIRNKSGGNSCKSCASHNTTQTQWVGTSNGQCSSGQWGYTSREKQQRRSVTYNCPAGTTTLPSPSYGSWTDTGSVRQTSASCTNCPASSTQEEKRWTGTSAANCSSGQYGEIAREREQRRTRSVSYNCPAGTTTLPSPTYGGWSGWSNTGNIRNKSGGNSCTACPANSTQTRWVAHTAANCSSGQYGKIEREKQQRRTVSYSCPAGTKTLPSPTYGSYTDTGSIRNKSGGNSCTSCPSNTTQYRWNARNPGCPSGQVGTHTYEMQQSRVRSYSCPAGTQTLPSPNYTTYVDTGTKRNVVNTCKPACTQWDEPITQTETIWSCPDGQMACEPGERSRTATLRHLCPSGTQVINPGSWQTIRNPVCPRPGFQCR